MYNSDQILTEGEDSYFKERAKTSPTERLKMARRGDLESTDIPKSSDDERLIAKLLEETVEGQEAMREYGKSIELMVNQKINLAHRLTVTRQFDAKKLELLDRYKRHELTPIS